MGKSRLQEELKKRQPFDCVEQEAALNVLRTGDLISNRFGRLFREHGITDSQYNVLRILRGEGKPMPCLEIAARLVQVVPAITGLIDRLEQQKLVERRRCTEDRRIIFVTLTLAGGELLARLDEPVLELHRRLLGHLPMDELQQMIRLMESARLGMAEEIPPPVKGDCAAQDHDGSGLRD